MGKIGAVVCVLRKACKASNSFVATAGPDMESIHKGSLPARETGEGEREGRGGGRRRRERVRKKMEREREIKREREREREEILRAVEQREKEDEGNKEGEQRDQGQRSDDEGGTGEVFLERKSRRLVLLVSFLWGLEMF